MACLRDSWRTSLPVSQQPRNPQPEPIPRNRYHSWRHRLKTLGRRHGLALDLVNAITGHGRKTVADGYGEFPMPALYREIQKIPAIEVQF